MIHMIHTLKLLCGAVITLAMSASSVYAVADCEQISLEGTFTAEGTEMQMAFEKIPYSQNAFRALGQGHPGGYTQVFLTNRYIRGGKLNCALAWYNPTQNDFEFNIISEQLKNGDLMIVGDTPDEGAPIRLILKK